MVFDKVIQNRTRRREEKEDNGGGGGGGDGFNHDCAISS